MPLPLLPDKSFFFSTFNIPVCTSTWLHSHIYVSLVALFPPCVIQLQQQGKLNIRTFQVFFILFCCHLFLPLLIFRLLSPRLTWYDTRNELFPPELQLLPVLLLQMEAVYQNITFQCPSFRSFSFCLPWSPWDRLRLTVMGFWGAQLWETTCVLCDIFLWQVKDIYFFLTVLQRGLTAS